MTTHGENGVRTHEWCWVHRPLVMLIFVRFRCTSFCITCWSFIIKWNITCICERNLSCIQFVNACLCVCVFVCVCVSECEWVWVWVCACVGGIATLPRIPPDQWYEKNVVCYMLYVVYLGCSCHFDDRRSRGSIRGTCGLEHHCCCAKRIEEHNKIPNHTKTRYGNETPEHINVPKGTVTPSRPTKHQQRPTVRRPLIHEVVSDWNIHQVLKYVARCLRIWYSNSDVYEYVSDSDIYFGFWGMS